MLEPWALQRSRFKKALINRLYQNACLTKASCLHATAVSEVESIRRLGLKNPVALIGNGVPIPETLTPRRAPVPGQRRRALFLSRIHPKKGLLNLVEAWTALRKSVDGEKMKGWELLIIGPDEGGHLAKVMAQVRAAGLQEEIRYGGERWGHEDKMQCYAEADLFVLPSYSENFGLVIAEALVCAVPVITTRATPWAELETHRCGWWIDTGKEALEQALREAIATPPGELRAMGLRGQELIKTKYSWEPVGRQMTAVYNWLAKRGAKPDIVMTD
jgi:glycosyltransferase involved in cell wall biosynthesis